MARVNISLDDELLQRSRAAGLNISRLAARALAEELDRRTRLAALDAYLDELGAAAGAPSSEAEGREAREWTSRVEAQWAGQQRGADAPPTDSAARLPNRSA